MDERENQIDYKLANLLVGEHTIEGDHIDRVIRLAEIKVLDDAVHAAGMHRHTNDWDWFISVTYGKFGDTPATIEDIFSIELDAEWDGFVACIESDKAQVLHCSAMGDDPLEPNNQLTYDISIDEIRSITYDWR